MSGVQGAKGGESALLKVILANKINISYNITLCRNHLYLLLDWPVSVWKELMIYLMSGVQVVKTDHKESKKNDILYMWRYQYIRFCCFKHSRVPKCIKKQRWNNGMCRPFYKLHSSVCIICFWIRATDSGGNSGNI